MHVDVQGGFWRAVENTKVFFKSIGDAPEKKDNAAIVDIINQDLIGGLRGTTTIKAYTENQSTVKEPSENSSMSILGILRYTNIERVKYGLKPLTLNTKLSNSALVKVEDMFTLQYFEHLSPTGKTAADLVRAQGYDFQSVGENLALGDFGTDKNLVNAWMNSPLHKKNILNPKFTELGLAVARSTYKGDIQWLAVQHFAKPAPVCEEISSSVKEKIDLEKNALEIEEQELKKLAEEIEADPNQNKSEEFLTAYNARVAKYNAQLGTLRDLIKDYNVKIEAYNLCLTS
jgi:uncharacterized protein YkwD